MDYRKKLEEFNETDKYKSELRFLKGLIGGCHNYVLDYGCGTGTAANYLQLNSNNNISGYDKTEHNKSFWYAKPTTPFDVVYFMHSIAHVENIEDVLKSLITKRVVIITPNAEWIALNQEDDYIPDPTVKRHFSQITLHYLMTNSGYTVKNFGQFGKFTNGINERLFLIAEKI